MRHGARPSALAESEKEQNRKNYYTWQASLHPTTSCAASKVLRCDQCRKRPVPKSAQILAGSSDPQSFCSLVPSVASFCCSLHLVPNRVNGARTRGTRARRGKTGSALRFLADRAERERAMAAIQRKYWTFRPASRSSKPRATDTDLHSHPAETRLRILTSKLLHRNQ